MQDNRHEELIQYRIKTANETLLVANELLAAGHYKDAINRAYYAAFYAIRAILAQENIDFKKHKDVVAYFNKNYVANEMVSKDLGRKIAKLQQKREKSDYDDFFIVARNEAELQCRYAEEIIESIISYLQEN